MRSYIQYLAERFVIFAATIFISVTVVFAVPRLVPGDPMNAVLSKLGEMGGVRGARELVEAYRAILGLDQPIMVQYFRYLRELLRGNLGVSIAMFPIPVSEVLMRALPWTIGLLTVTTIISWILGTFIGAVVGWQGEESKMSKVLVPVALILYSIPYYILAIVLVFLFAFLWQIFPLSGGHSLPIELSLESLGDLLWHAMLPALSIILVSLGWWFLSMRSMIIPLQGEDYIVLAKAKGLRPGRILWKYAFRNALLPQVTGLALALGRVVSGAIITEVIFAYPGIGWRLYESITGLDFPMIQGGVLLIVMAVVTANLIIDVTYPFIDPRIRYRRK
jgi:peptide/nickel transport system permease protein